MLVVHGIWARGAMRLWAEYTTLPAQTGAPVASRPRPAGQDGPALGPRPHPFAAPAPELADALAGLPEPLPDLARKAVDGDLTLLLPTVGDEPLAAPESGREPPRGRQALAAWRVPALVFEPQAAMEALGALDRRGESYPDLMPGATLAYFAVAARFAADLAARGRVLPALVAEEGGYAARWRPVLSAADAQRARELAAAMPPLCRAAIDSPTAAAPAATPPAGALLADALEAFADRAARARLQAPLLPARRGRPPRPH